MPMDSFRASSRRVVEFGCYRVAMAETQVGDRVAVAWTPMDEPLSEQEWQALERQVTFDAPLAQ